MKKQFKPEGIFRFSAVIYKIGINPLVDLPEEILKKIFAQAGRSKGPIPVRGLLNGVKFIQTLVKYQGLWRLYINGPMLKLSGACVGDTATIEVEFDPLPREVPMPKAFADALKADKRAAAAYEKLTPSRKKEILRYLGSLKNRESLDRNVEKILGHLNGAESEKPHVVMRSKKKN